MRAFTVAFLVAVAMTATTLAAPSKTLPSIRRIRPKQEIRAVEDLDIEAILKQLPITLEGVAKANAQLILTLSIAYEDEPELAKARDILDKAVASAEKEIKKFLALAPLLIPFPERLQALVEKTIGNLITIAEVAESEVHGHLEAALQNHSGATYYALLDHLKAWLDAVDPLYQLLVPILP